MKTSGMFATVSNKSLEKLADLARTAQDLFAKFKDQQARGGHAQEESVVFNLSDYVLRFGNPLVAGHRIAVTYIGGKAQLSMIALVSGVRMERGRFELAGPVVEATPAGKELPQSLRQLARMRVGDLRLITDTKVVVEGYWRHNQLVEQVGGQLLTLSNKGSGASDAGCSKVASSVGTDAVGRGAVAQPTSSTRSGPSPLATIASSCSRSDPDRRQGRNKRGGPARAPVLTPVKREAHDDDGHDLAAPSARAIRRSSTAHLTPADKEFEQKQAKAIQHLAMFNDDGWGGGLRGRQNTWEKFIESLELLKEKQ